MGIGGKSGLDKMKVMFLLSHCPLWNAHCPISNCPLSIDSMCSLCLWLAATQPSTFTEVREKEEKSCHVLSRSRKSFCETYISQRTLDQIFRAWKPFWEGKLCNLCQFRWFPMSERWSLDHPCTYWVQQEADRTSTIAETQPTAGKVKAQPGCKF